MVPSNFVRILFTDDILLKSSIMLSVSVSAGGLVKAGSHHLRALASSLLLCVSLSVPAASQLALTTPEVPDKFNLDMQTAARLRPQLLSQSSVASGRYETGRLVFEKLVEQVRASRNTNLAWALRIVDDKLLNAYASPDGTIYVESGLAQLAGRSTGLWSAILSHEIAHALRRDWARRYLFEKSLESSGGATLVLGDPGLLSGGWTDSKKASANLAEFCRQMELDADLAGLMLMARAGYHPDFVPALHHLLHAQEAGTKTTKAKTASLYAMHPCWEERDRQLERAYVAASIAFERLWPEWYASPGGNPPTIVFADEPVVKKTGSKEWEVQVPIHCQNLAGAVEVVLRKRSVADGARDQQLLSSNKPAQQSARIPSQSDEVRQLTGCTSPKTTVIFTLPENFEQKKSSALPLDVYVFDDSGAVLSRADVPRLLR